MYHIENTAVCGKINRDNGEKDLAPEWNNNHSNAAFLGPNIWEKTLPCSSDFKLEYMDIEEFLKENEIFEELFKRMNNENAGKEDKNPCSYVTSNEPVSNTDTLLNTELQIGPSSSSEEIKEEATEKRKLCRRSSSVASFASSSEPYSSDSEHALAPTLADNFDPRVHSLSEEDLKPQPMIKKGRKQYVPTEMKDDRYWVRRRKNNMAAKKSRDARRLKENQIALRANFLEKENNSLRMELENTKRLLEDMKKKLSTYES